MDIFLDDPYHGNAEVSWAQYRREGMGGTGEPDERNTG